MRVVTPLCSFIKPNRIPPLKVNAVEERRRTKPLKTGNKTEKCGCNAGLQSEHRAESWAHVRARASRQHLDGSGILPRVHCTLPASSGRGQQASCSASGCRRDDAVIRPQAPCSWSPRWGPDIYVSCFYGADVTTSRDPLPGISKGSSSMSLERPP